MATTGLIAFGLNISIPISALAKLCVGLWTVKNLKDQFWFKT